MSDIFIQAKNVRVNTRNSQTTQGQNSLSYIVKTRSKQGQNNVKTRSKQNIVKTRSKLFIIFPQCGINSLKVLRSAKVSILSNTS